MKIPRLQNEKQNPENKVHEQEKISKFPDPKETKSEKMSNRK